VTFRNGPARVVVAEDDVLLREGVAQVLRAAGFDVVGSAGNATAIRSEVRALRPDVLVTDIRMPPGNADDGLRAAIDLRSALPELAVMVLSQFVQRTYALELVGDNPGGVGYLLKQRVADVIRFAAAVQQVADGGTVLDPEVVQAMLDVKQASTSALDALTPRQREVLRLVAEGRSNAAIAERLGVGEKSVVQYVSKIYDVFGLPPNADDHRRVLAVLRYLTG
jgi:DNA-binding NarL/FixJ family response regulator